MSALFLGDYDTEDEAAYAYNVAKKILEPDCPLNSLNYGMNLTNEQKSKVEETVKMILILVP